MALAALPLPVKDAAVRVSRTAAAVLLILAPAATVLAADVPEHAEPALLAPVVVPRVYRAVREDVHALAVHFASRPCAAELGAMTPLHPAEAVRRALGNLTLVLVAVLIQEHAHARRHAAHHVAGVHEAGAVADAPPACLLIRGPLAVVARAVGALQDPDARPLAVRPLALEVRAVGVCDAAVAVRAPVAARPDVLGLHAGVAARRGVNARRRRRAGHDGGEVGDRDGGRSTV